MIVSSCELMYVLQFFFVVVRSSSRMRSPMFPEFHVSCGSHAATPCWSLIFLFYSLQRFHTLGWSWWLWKAVLDSASCFHVRIYLLSAGANPQFWIHRVPRANQENFNDCELILSIHFIDLLFSCCKCHY